MRLAWWDRDENGGRWDHVAPPKIDIWGPGTRVPTILVSPFVKTGFVDHTQYETVSILAFIFVFPTILFGVFDWLHFFKGAFIAPIVYKMILASAVLVLLAIGIIVGSELQVRTAPMMG